MGEIRNAYRILVVICWGNRPLAKWRVYWIAEQLSVSQKTCTVKLVLYHLMQLFSIR
jgi:hypothetical protein